MFFTQQISFQFREICYKNNTFEFTKITRTHRCTSETEDTVSTDDDLSWGGCGKYEYSTKALPHAILHYPEMIQRAGHHGAYCASAPEMGHIKFNKQASTFTRIESSQNLSEENMLDWNLRQQVYSAVQQLNNETGDDSKTESPHVASDPTTRRLQSESTPSAEDESEFTLSTRLSIDEWESQLGVPTSWKNKFVGRTVRLTRNELLHLLGNKLRITGSERRETIFDDEVLLQMRQLRWEFFGVLTTPSRKFVASHPTTTRRDFVRLEDDVSTRGTSLAAQLIMFIHLSGFSSDGTPAVHDDDSVTYALVRWLTAHPRALVRDDALRPLCPPPLDINHALWKFAEEDRSLLTPRIVNQNITSYPGNTMSESLAHMRSEQRAWFGLVEIDCIREILNCTSVDNDLNTILQTITLPFQ